MVKSLSSSIAERNVGITFLGPGLHAYAVAFG
jgi:hypothetical protein